MQQADHHKTYVSAAHLSSHDMTSSSGTTRMYLYVHSIHTYVIMGVMKDNLFVSKLKENISEQLGVRI